MIEYAFPYERSNGMTLRDYFAAQAMQALLTRFSHNPYELARMSFEVADAMVETSTEKLSQS